MSESPHTVLLVDDDPALLGTLGRVLKSTGHRILMAESPAEALKLLDAGGVDLLLTDLDMPQMSGVELLARVRRSHPDVVRMLLTGGATLDSALRAINDGGVHKYLTKPTEPAALRAAVDEGLARLDEHRAAAAAERQQQQRGRLLAELEREHPGIAAVDGPEGERRLDDERLDALIATLQSSALKGFFST